jgi:hypothetical protein
MFGCIASLSSGQTTTSAVVPPLVKFSGSLSEVDGRPMTGVVGVTFYLYKSEQGGAPVWMETQNIQLDRAGNYSAMLGSTTSQGLPADLFVSGEARWLGVQVEGQPERPRVLLLSVPYALKAGDAETLGGFPLSAFVRAQAEPSSTSAIATPGAGPVANVTPPPAGAVTGAGTADFVPLWSSASNIGNSVLFQSGTGATAKIGLNTTTPVTPLDVKGATTVRGNLSLPTTGTATATAGKNSQPLTFTASVFNSSSTTPVNQNFRWQAEPVGNNTATATGSLNLLYAQGAGTQAETGLKIGSNGLITFASGQKFPGTGAITGVSPGVGLTGGGTSGNLTLNVDATKVPLLNASNTFTGNQTVNGNISASSLQSGTGTFTANGTVAVTVTQNSDIADGIDVNSAGYGVLARTTYVGVYGQSDSDYGVWGNTSAAAAAGVYGDAGAGFGVLAQSVQSQALWAESQGTGSSNGAGPDGVHGVAHSSAGSGVAGINDAASGIGVYGRETASGSYAGRFDGNVWVNGNLSKNGGSFKIDHPLDPSNKYLYHSFVESPDMKNIYDGVVTLDASGEAVVSMPEWFGALNRDFRYQLTCIGGFAPVYIAEEITNNQFKIGGGKQGMKVSWQVTGTRQDAWANAHRIPVEEVKPKDEHGTYLSPELFGAPETSAVGWGRYRFPDNSQPHKAVIRHAPANRGSVTASQARVVETTTSH